MKILLIRPKPHNDTIGLQSVMICQPLELMTLSSVLKANSHEVIIVDMILEKRSLREILAEHSPELVGITGYISHIGVMKEYAKEVKQFDSSIVVAVGGVHATVCPDDFESEYIDKICVSENDLYDIAGCTDKTRRLPDRELPKEYTERYYYLFQDKCALVKTSYGCPFNCNFCFCKLITPYSARDIDEVIEELLQIPQKEVYIVDDDFLFNRERLIDFYEKLKANKIEKNYLVYGRADFISKNEDVIAMLKEVGLSAVIVGLEAASQETLDKYNKKTGIDDNVKAVDILKKYDIECYATVILGIDWEKKDFDRLHRFIKKCEIVFVNLQPLTPMPGTEYLDIYRDKLIIPYNQHEKWDMAHLVVSPEKISVREFYFRTLMLYYKITLTPKNISYMIRRYGLKTTLKLSRGASKISWQYIKKIIKGA